jgi:hypothetical protein
MRRRKYYDKKRFGEGEILWQKMIMGRGKSYGRKKIMGR